MIYFRNISFLIFLVLLSSCKEKENELEFNKHVLSEILPDVVDVFCVDIRIFSKPPPKYGVALYDDKGKYIRTDTTQVTEIEEEQLRKWKNEIELIKKDTAKVIIAFDPIIFPYIREYKIIENKYFPKQEEWKEYIDDKQNQYILDFENIKLNGKFKLKNINEFDKENIFENNYDFNFSGTLVVSGIKFDERNENGVLDVGFHCGRLCGYGGKVYITYLNGKWKIIKTEETWDS